MVQAKALQVNSNNGKNSVALFARACAGGADLSVLILSWFAFHSYYMAAPGSNMTVIYVADRIFPFVLILYFTLFEWYWGKTPGKWMFNLKVSTIQGRVPNFKVTVFRNVLKFFSIFILFGGYIMALFRKDNLAFHDILSGCMVTKKGNDN